MGSIKKIGFVFLLGFIMLQHQYVLAQTPIKTDYVTRFNNTNYPQIAYWFLTPAVLENEKYLSDLNTMIDNTLFDFIFLDAREGCSFDKLEIMHPVMQKIVALAHQRNIKIGFRTHVAPMNQMPDSILERFVAEAETKLNSNGQGSCATSSSYVRAKKSYKKQVYKVFCFKKTAAGFYDPSTFKELTNFESTIKGETITVNINAGKSLAGYTAYVMTEYLYKMISNYSDAAKQQTIQLINAYADIPLDGLMLDEFSNARLMPSWLIKFKMKGLRLRSYSIDMAKELAQRTGQPASTTLFNMRYAPTGQPAVRIKAINYYMNLMREGALHVEHTMYKRAKEVFGPNCFIAAHNTFHNSLVNDDIWATGIKWWSIPRAHGFTDEKTPTPTQMGIAMSYPANAMYNMYYDGNINRFAKKTLTDLRYGIRTFYHAFNDTHWGMDLEQAPAIAALQPVENAARLLNQFNPSLPELKLLVVFGNEALQNWYPNESARGKYDINSKLKIEEKAVAIWSAGYRNALVPTDLISEGKLTLNANHQALLNGHVFDAIIFLYPEYAKESTLKFLEDYVIHGGKLMLEGDATRDFDANDISSRFSVIKNRATVKAFSIASIGQLGIQKNVIKNGTINADGSYVFTDLKSLKNNQFASFSFYNNHNHYTGTYKGLAAIKLNEQGGLEKIAATQFSSLKKNGKEILGLNKSADMFLTQKNGIPHAIIADSSTTIQLKSY
jgi:hypothetical protein